MPLGVATGVVVLLSTAGPLSSSTQASVYCVAAVLWTAAKFSIPRDRKLALPRRLKTLLLDMARRSTQERLSAAEAIKVTALQWGQLPVGGLGGGPQRTWVLDPRKSRCRWTGKGMGFICGWVAGGLGCSPAQHSAQSPLLS